MQIGLPCLTPYLMLYQPELWSAELMTIFMYSFSATLGTQKLDKFTSIDSIDSLLFAQCLSETCWIDSLITRFDRQLRLGRSEIDEEGACIQEQ